MIQLRDFQAELKAEVKAGWAAGSQNMLAVLPTGGGKTVVFSSLASDETAPVVLIAHRAELVSQMALSLAKCGIRHAVVGPPAVRRACVAVQMIVLKKSWVDANATVAVCGVLALQKYQPSWIRRVGLWVIDEAHHCLRENMWGAAVAMFPAARGLGVTATPMRADGRGLGRHADGVFDQMVVGPGMRELIAGGYLCEYSVIASKADIDLTSVPVSAQGDFSPQPLRAAVHASSQLTGDVVSHYLKFAAGKTGITFAVDIEAATEYAAAYRQAGVPAEVITGKTPDALRYGIQRKFQNREILQLVNVDLFGEGYDLPALEVVTMARPTQSYGLYAQQFGRVLRTMEGKTKGAVIDHVGNVVRHRLPDAARAWTLDRREKRSRTTPDDGIPLRACLNVECLAVYERVNAACPFCGHAPTVTARNGPELVDGDLTELDEATLAALRGEIDRVQGPVRIPQMLPRSAQIAVANRHLQRQLAQAALREAMAVWAGGFEGVPESELYRRFYFKFGIDVATAQTLGAAEAGSLTLRVRS